MLTYLSHPKEDATNLIWSNAKAANAIILCGMEQVALHWGHNDRFDRIHRSYATKHSNSNQHWGKMGYEHYKPWFCMQFQMGVFPFPKEHEAFGKMPRHICSYCLSIGKVLNLAAKDCYALNKVQSKKTDSQLLRVKC